MRFTKLTYQLNDAGESFLALAPGFVAQFSFK